jgi:type I restriction enzyme, S subunit
MMVRLGDHIKLVGGGTPSKEIESFWNGNIPWVSVKDMKDDFISSTADCISEEGLNKSASKLIPAGTLLIATRMAVGRVSFPKMNVAINQDLKAIFVDDKIDTKFLFYSLKAKEEYFNKISTGATVKGIKIEHITDLKFPLPPLSEQKRIAELLDAADTLRKKDKALLEKYDQLAQSLFLEMFGESDFEKYELGTLCEIKGGKRLPKGKDFSGNPSDIPYLRVTDFRPNSFDDSKLKYVDNETSSEIKRYRISKEDVYISIAGTIGIAGLIPDHLNDSQLTENAAKLVIKDKTTLNKVFLSYFLNSEDCQNEIKPRTMAVGVPKLALFRLAELNIKLPSIFLQNQFAEQVQLIEKQKEIVKMNLEKSEELMKGLMGSVFG